MLVAFAIFFFLDLEELVATEKFDIIAITESWLNTKDRDFLAEYNLPRYSISSLHKCQGWPEEYLVGGG